MAGFRFEVIEDPAALRARIPAWDELAAAALEPNPFYESWMLLPALEAFGGGARLRFVFVHAERAGRPPQLCGFFPLERVARFKGFPFRHVRLWSYPHRFLGTPLLRPAHASACLEALLEWLAESGDASMIEWGRIGGDGAFHAALQHVLHASGRRSFVGQAFTRALLAPRADGDEYLRLSLQGTSRKEFRRLERRLAESGGLRYETLQPGAPAAGWAEQFLALEARGWKGRRGSALDCSDANRRFFLAVAAEAARRRRLMMLSLAAGGRTIAMKCNFLAHDGAFAFKIAYDEGYARYSPGTLLELENVREFHRRPALRWMDSCAEADHFMANRLWLDRREIRTVLTATGRAAGDLVVSSLPLLRRVAASWRAATLQPT
jgi:CelD/BcsL family acetyltransferase involved in cellulose biosynthesis